MKRITTLALLCVAFLGVQSAMAWGGWGHHITAYIAEHHLTPEAKAKCQHYLKHNLPHYSVWQDYFRHSKPFQEIHYWHMNYVDENFSAIGNKGNITRDATYQIERIVKEMGKGGYKNLSDSIVNLNLKLLIHMVGDMHCPSHVAYPKEMGLKGGKLYNNGKRVNRHTFWDGSPQYLHPKWKADKFLEVCDTYNEKQIKKVQKGNASKWGIENGRAMVRTYECWEDGDDVKKMTKEQREAIDEIVFGQLRKGGYRLAAVLNNIFKY